MPVKVHKEGRKIIVALILFLILLNLFLVQIFPEQKGWFVGGLIVSVVSLFCTVAFFRVPKRDQYLNEDCVLAPADGKVVAIEEVEEPEYFNEKRLLVSVFMSVRNAHVNRNPISGLVKYVKYHQGKYLVAWHPKSSTDNERTSIVIENGDFNVLVRQIAGTVARRIVYYLDEGDEVQQGNELGFIKFGSRVDMYLPLGTKVNVKLKEKVKAGKTVIARFS